MRTVNIVTNGKTTHVDVVANDHETHYINGQKYVDCLLGGVWTRVKAEKLHTVKSNPFAAL